MRLYNMWVTTFTANEQRSETSSIHITYTYWQNNWHTTCVFGGQNTSGRKKWSPKTYIFKIIISSITPLWYHTYNYINYSVIYYNVVTLNTFGFTNYNGNNTYLNYFYITFHNYPTDHSVSTFNYYIVINIFNTCTNKYVSIKHY